MPLGRWTFAKLSSRSCHLDEITTRMRYCVRNAKRVGAIKRREAWYERAVAAQVEGEKLLIRLLRL